MCTAGGPVAQLGERHTGSVEVMGSSPIGSTIVSLYIAREMVDTLTRSAYRDINLCPKCVLSLIKSYRFTYTTKSRRTGVRVEVCASLSYRWGVVVDNSMRSRLLTSGLLFTGGQTGMVLSGVTCCYWSM